MPFEANVAIAAVVMLAAFIADWPRALAGVAFGVVSRFLPYSTIIIPIGVFVIAAAGEFIYPWLGRTHEASFESFLVGLFSVAGTASSVYVTVRNLKDRL